PVLLLLICIPKSVLSCQGNCNEVLESSEGIFTSPCYPSDYPPSQSCAWTLQAPAGFIIQITFLDFELEEVHGCIYDRVVIDNGSGTSNSFCGLTANGLALNSTGNVMTVYFSSDFSVQKKGFSISYRQVAVALRNQKVTVPQNSKDVIKVTSTVSFPELNEFTVCFEIARLTQKSTETIFTYLDASDGVLLSFGAIGSKMQLSICSVKCFIDDLVTSVDFTSQIQLFCLTWSKTNGRVAVNFGGNYRVNTCSASVGLSVDPGGSLELGGGGGGLNFNSIIYNFRLWDSAKTFSELSALTCDAVGNIVDWDNSFWDIPASYAQTDPSLSCIKESETCLWCFSRYTSKALLLYRNTTGKDLMSTEIETKLNSSSASGDLRLENIVINVIENCPEEDTLHYKWLETRPLDTKNISCFPYKEQNASRTCMISPDNYTSFWGQPDFSSCKDIEEIEVSSGNAVEVAVHLADITNNELSTAEVSQVVTVVKKLVNVARINATLATTVVTIISNVMITSDSAQMAASGTALKTMEELVQKIEFDGPSLSITSKNLAVGISALNTSSFNGTSFSAFIPPNGTDPQIHFESEIQNPLAAVTLPATLLNNLSTADIETISRINFMFFSKTGLFQDQQSNGLSLNSYVVASSVGNFTISNLRDPVQIEIAHLHSLQKNAKPQCVFWDFTMQNGSGGWNSEGCVVSSESSSNRTVCLCSHLTHFGILMDISGAAVEIDERDTKILTFITYIGCGISAIFSAVTILTYIAFEKLRRDYPSKILMNLSTSLLFLNMVFLLDGWLASYNNEGLCVAVAVFLHFFLLTSFTWMGLESIHMYIALVKVFNTYIRRYILKFCIVGWGLPAAIVGIVVAVDKDSYGKEYYGKGENGQGSSEFCWIRSKVVFYVTCVAYFSIIFLMNVAMFIVVMMQICGRNGKRSNRTVREEVLRNLRSAVSLTFLLGMTWGFAFFAWGPVNLAFMYLFSIFNSLQGLFIFIFHCALKENVQKQWRRYLCCGKFRLADNSDWSKTATNNTKKVSSDNLGKSLSSSSFGSTTANWTSKAKTTLNPFAKRHSSTGEVHCYICL
uniref:Adhesion G-protein coupled receptor G6 n=1 Tax=Pygocentrus nattereri TaxID=42514 RepID=A0A3B4DCN3_PYGNA